MTSKATESAGIARSAHGAAPTGVTTEEAASRWVRGMFGKIAGHYDLLNHLLSFNLDRRWRARTVERVAGILENPNARILDLCCGTADILLALEERAPGTARPQILGSDFCHPMLVEARRKIEARRNIEARRKTEARKSVDRGLGSPLFEADALALPLADESLDLITVAFGFRNLANYRQGLVELARVLKPGGTLAILEFSQPTNRAFRSVYGFFSTRVLPRVGGLISGSAEAYSYLPDSIRKFPGAEDLAAQMSAAGFAHVEFERMTCGAVALHLARK